MSGGRTNKYTLEFSDSDWEEILSLTFPPFEIEQGEPLIRIQWIAIGHMCLGKAYRINTGAYDEPDFDDGCDLPAWAEQLQNIAEKIFETFQPGDGQV